MKKSLNTLLLILLALYYFFINTNYKISIDILQYLNS